MQTILNKSMKQLLLLYISPMKLIFTKTLKRSYNYFNCLICTFITWSIQYKGVVHSVPHVGTKWTTRSFRGDRVSGSVTQKAVKLTSEFCIRCIAIMCPVQIKLKQRILIDYIVRYGAPKVMFNFVVHSVPVSPTSMHVYENNS